MKKFLSMFAFMAVLVLGAFTLASCGSDDDEPSAPTYKFALQLKVDTPNAATKENPIYKQTTAELEKMFEAMGTFEMTEDQASKQWDVTFEQAKKVCPMQLEALWTITKDTDITIALIMTKNGQVWKNQVWSAVK